MACQWGRSARKFLMTTNWGVDLGRVQRWGWRRIVDFVRLHMQLRVVALAPGQTNPGRHAGLLAGGRKTGVLVSSSTDPFTAAKAQRGKVTHACCVVPGAGLALVRFSPLGRWPHWMDGRAVVLSAGARALRIDAWRKNPQARPRLRRVVGTCLLMFWPGTWNGLSQCAGATRRGKLKGGTGEWQRRENCAQHCVTEIRNSMAQQSRASVPDRYRAEPDVKSHVTSPGRREWNLAGAGLRRGKENQ
ncbi:hypothetical protein BKA81DRAFT_380211 [Phyllosticta paracitricarpa]